MKWLSDELAARVEAGEKTTEYERVQAGYERCAAFTRATQRKGQPMTYGSGKPAEKP